MVDWCAALAGGAPFIGPFRAVSQKIVRVAVEGIERRLRKELENMAIVSRPDSENNHILYDIPEELLEAHRVPADKLAQMFPVKEDRDRAEAVAIVAAGSDDSDVQAY